MKFCEFFLQKELSDRENRGQESNAWLPLKTNALEIEEGKYRLAAYCNRANIDVEVRIIYQSSEEGKFQPRSKERVCRSNSRGLVPVLPLIYLKQGLWEIRCRSNANDDPQEQFGQATLQLKVLAKAIIEEEEEVSTTPENKAREAKLQAYANSVIKNSLNELEQFFARSVEPILQELDALSIPSFNRSSALEPPDNKLRSAQNLEGAQLKLTLDRDMLIWSVAESILISGTVESLNNDLSQSENLSFKGILRYQLRNPQNGEIFQEFEQNLLEQKLPFVFNYCLEIAPDCQTHLILGEVFLEENDLQADRQNNSALLTSETFTITADLDRLLQTLPKQETNSLLIKQIEEEVETRLNKTFSAQIKLDFDEETISDSVVLYGESSNVDDCFPILTQKEPLFSQIDSLKTEFNFSTLLPINSSNESYSEIGVNSILETHLDRWEKTIQEIRVLENSLDERSLIKIEDLPQSVEDGASWEFLVEDEEELLPEKITNVDTEELSTPSAPVLIIEDKELNPGQSVFVVIKLPFNASSVCVKLWIKDYQSRCLIGTPQTISDFQPNPTGELEAKIKLDLPKDIMQICFEAIAIDLDRQTESHKVSLTKIVLAPFSLGG